MLSGSWRRSPLRHTRSLPVGRDVGKDAGATPILLEALYDYSYHGADGRVVSMQEGEFFTLLKKSNADWWQVRRYRAGTKGKALYVPAAYVQEVPVTRATLSGPQPTGLPASTRLQTHCSVPTKALCRSMEDLNRNGFPRTPRSDASTSPSHWLAVPTGVIPRSQSSSNLPQNPYREERRDGHSHPRSYSQWDMGNRHTDEHIQTSRSSLSEQERKQWAEPPCPLPGQQPIQTLQMWEQYRDSASGRSFYVNTLTKERSWKPPRRVHQRSPTKNTVMALHAGTFPRDSNHLSLPLQNAGTKTTHRFSPDFTRISWDATNCQLNQERQIQTMERAVSSDALISASFSSVDTQRRSSALTGHGGHVSHSRSMTLPSQTNVPSSNGKSEYSMLMGSPSTDSSPDSDGLTPELEKAGLLNKTKIAEGGRKLRKNWNLSWVVLVGNSLMFFKDPKSQSPDSWKPGNSCPESSVDLRGAKLQWANDLSSKKNVFKLRTITGNEFLLQSETVSLISEWYTTIQKVIHKLDKENPLDNGLVYSLRRAGSMDMLDQSGDEEENPGGTRTTLTRSVYNLENSEHKRVKNRLKKLMLRRPPLQTLQEKGLIKDQVFGCSLEVLCEREKSTVPRFVRQCTKTVEQRGLETDGIYRVSGNLAIIQKLRFAVNHERAVSTDGRYLFPEHLVQGSLSPPAGVGLPAPNLSSSVLLSYCAFRRKQPLNTVQEHKLPYLLKPA